MSNRPPTVQTFAVEKQFDGDSNWLAFKSQLLLAAGSAGVAGYIDGSIIEPSGLSAPFLSGTSTQTFVTQSDESDSAANIWAALIAEYDSSTEVGKITAKNSLRAERFRDGDDFATFLKTMCRLRMEANHAGAKITDKDFRTIFLMALPMLYNTMISTFKGVAWMDVLSRLKDFAAQNAKQEAETAALAASTSSSAATPVICGNCGKKGHITINCWAEGGGAAGKAPEWYKAKGKKKKTPDTTSTDANTVTTTAETYILATAINERGAHKSPSRMQPLIPTSIADVWGSEILF
ncbi:hypothetical protein CPB85DRAFT_1258141 [Mucidula mucida]|nr:hypothetical protein CPB85DRAFT_1258141 [Mucidula mucida]